MNGTTYQETVRWRGAPIRVDAIRAENKVFIISGRFIKTAALKNEWQEDIEDPDRVIRELQASPAKIDLLRFWQRIPESEPKYGYYHECRDVAAIPISDYRTWWERQVNSNTRRLIRKSEKQGVTAIEVELQDELVLGITEMFNECPVRRGKPFWHYGKDFEAVKRDMLLDLNEAIFIGAYYEKELIGFVKLIVADRYAMITLILDKMVHRNKAPMNAMVAKAVKICTERKIPFLTYTLWRRGGHRYFQERNGFQRISVPEYYVPLTLRGRLALRLGLHKGLKGLIPEKVRVWLLTLRAKWYASKYPEKAGGE
jgi:hypothetical protein